MKKLFSLVLFLTLCSVWLSARTDVTSQYLQNANLSALTGWNYGDGGYDYTDWKTDGSVPVIEFYHTYSQENPGAPIGSTKNFHFTQNVTLPAGNYRLVTNAFYREGVGDGSSKAVLVAGTQQKNIVGLKAGDLNSFSGSNELYKAANAFSQGYYVNYIDFTIDAEQEVTLGMQGYIDTYISWCILGPMKLYQYESEEEKEDVPSGFPKAQTLESGKTYYLYNVGSQKFIYRNSNSVKASATTRTGVIIKAKGDGTYTMQFSDDNSYIWTSSTNMNSQSGIDSDVYFRITEVEGGYTIQRNRNYDATHYVANNSDANVYADQTSGNTVWQLLNVYEADYYFAKKALGDALNAAVGYEFAKSEYQAVYDNESSTPAEMNAAAAALNNGLGMSKGYQAPWWNERPILFSTADGSFGQDYWDTWALPNNSYTTGTYFERILDVDRQSSISATVLVEEPSTLVYGLDGGEGYVKVYVDGTEVRDLTNLQFRTYPSSKTYTRFFEELEPGLHTITWTYINYASYSNWYYLYDVSVMSKPQISVNLLEPGSLGTEVLYNTDHIKNVRRLKVKGAMNSDDWAKIKMMSTLLELDLSEAQFTEIPAKQFQVSSSDTTMNFLHKIVLPEGLTTIGDKAFHYSFVEDINLPSTMRRVGKEAFYRSHVKELIMPDDMTDFYGGEDDGYCFEYMYWLERLVLPRNLTRIPNYTFYEGYHITEAVMPEKLQIVGYEAFRSCHRMQTVLPEGLKTVEGYGFFDCHALNSSLPSTLTTIGECAFQGADGYTSLVIPESVTTIGEYAFANCGNLEFVELGVNQYSLDRAVFRDCGKLTTVKLKSPTVTKIQDGSSDYYPLSDITSVTIQVPHYLVNNYKLHSYWYNAKAIVPFDYSDVSYIPIHDNLTLNHERFGGQPSVDVFVNAYLKINGDAAQQINNLYACTDGYERIYGQLLNNCDQITASGNNMLSYRTEAMRWYFISLPFDLDVSRTALDGNGAQYAIRYYDGAGRAANGNSGNWKNVDRTSIIPAGTGFIYQTNVSTWTHFLAADTENKYGTLRTTEFNKTLEVNASDNASNKGWNLVGNPYQCFYNNHSLNFTAPITVWNGSTYVAYSLTDDDYAIRPNEAFFVQCPNEEYNTIGFPIQGRQLTSVIENQNAGARALASAGQARQVVNLSISNGESEDQTRVVLNEEASEAYEMTCDASKFMSMDNSVPQIYTLDNAGTVYAINERPMKEGNVDLGVYAGQTGDYTISVTRCDAGQVFITDNLTGKTSEITNSAYAFSAKAGADNSRFTLSFVPDDVTAVSEIERTESAGKVEVYSIDGKFLGTDASHLNSGLYIIRQGKNVRKLVVR